LLIFTHYSDVRQLLCSSRYRSDGHKEYDCKNIFHKKKAKRENEYDIPFGKNFL